MKHLHYIKILALAFILTFIISCTNNNVASLDIKKLEPIGWEDKVPCIITFTDSRSNVELTARIKYRGGISSRYNKHSFSLELDKKHSLGNLPDDDDWILNANYIDKTFMRHKINYDLFRHMSPNNIAAKSSFINLSINNNYKGLYVLMEEINASMIGVDKNDSLAMLFKDPHIFSPGNISEVDYSLEYYQQKYPNVKINDKTAYIEKFKDFIFNSDDKDFANGISSWVDINNVIDWHIILLFSNNADGIMKNFYLYKLDTETPFRFAIWDYDHSFGRDGDNEPNMMEKELNCNRSILLKRLTQIAETGYKNRLIERWNELRELNIISNRNFHQYVDQNNNIIKNVIDENFVKWPIESKWYYDNNNYQQEIDLMLQFVELRIEQLDKYFDNL